MIVLSSLIVSACSSDVLGEISVPALWPWFAAVGRPAALTSCSWGGVLVTSRL